MDLKQYSVPSAVEYRMVLENCILSNQNESPVIDDNFPGEEED